MHFVRVCVYVCVYIYVCVYVCVCVCVCVIGRVILNPLIDWINNANLHLYPYDNNNN